MHLRFRQLRFVFPVVAAFLATSGCRQKAEQSSIAPVPAIPAAAILAPGAFRIKNIEHSRDGSNAYVAAAGDSDLCQFEIVIGDQKHISGAPFAFSTATLVRRSGADCTEFLQALAPTLGFHGHLPSAPAVANLSVSIAVLGVNQSRDGANGEVAGGFVSNPQGPWIVTKLFLADGEGEVFLNLNPKDGVGEFSLKEEDYADIVVNELAKILLPQPRDA